MIVSRKSAEGFLGKKLEGLGGGKRSYYVLSSDGTKNLGGPHTKEGAKQRLREVEYFKRNPETFDCMKLAPALLVLEEPDGLPLWHHARTATDMRSILRTGFRLGRNPKILPGVYTVPFGWEKPDKKLHKHVLEIRLKKGTVVLDTDSERPMHAVAGIGHKSWNALWVHVLKGMRHPFALAKKHNDQDWAAKNEDKLNAFLMGDGRWERREKYVKGMAAELKRCKVDALIQGGEFIILNPKSIASVTEYAKQNPRKNPRTGDTRFGPSDIRYERRFIELEGLGLDLGSGFEIVPGPRYAPHNIDDLLAHIVSSRTRKEIIAYVNKQDVDWPYRGKWDSQTPWSTGGLLGASYSNPVSIIYEIFHTPGLEAIEKYPELRKILNSRPEKPEAAAAVAMDWMLRKGIEPYWATNLRHTATQRTHTERAMRRLQRANPRKRNPGGLREIYTRFSPNDIRYHRQFIHLNKLPSSTVKRLAEVARQSLGVWRRSHSRVISPGEVDRILGDALLSARPSILTDARIRKGIIDYTNRQEVDWPYRGEWSREAPWDQLELRITKRASPRRANPVSIIFEIFGEEGLKAIENSSELREILDSHPDNPKVAAAVGMDWMLGHGVEPLFGSRGAMKDLQRANPGDVIPIGRAVGFEHYGEPALPKEEAKRRSERRRKGGFIHEGIPARLLTAEERKKIARLEGNPRPFLKREHDWNEVLIDRAGKKLTRKQIRDYYKRVEKRIWPYLEGQTVMVIFAPRKNEFILRRKRDGDDRYIKLTKLKGIDDQNSLEYWVNRRAIEFHVVLTTKTAPILWLDLDMHKTRDKAARAALLRKMKKATRRIKKVFREMGVNRVFVYESGQDGGLHFEGDLPKRRNVDALRRAFTKALDKEFEGDEVFTTGLAKSGQIRLDTTTFHHLGSLRAPYSMTIRGTPKKRITT